MAISASVGVGLLIAGTSLYAANKQNQIAKDQMNQQNEKEQQLETEKQNQQLNEQSLQASKAIRTKAQNTAQDYGQKSGTILTSPNGISGSATQSGGANKTLLGM